MAEIACVDCGGPVPPWGKSQTRRRERCPECQKAHLKRYNREYQRERLGITEQENRCSQCGCSFVSTRTNRKFCSEACRNDSKRAPKRACQGCGTSVQPPKKRCDDCRRCPCPGCERPKTRRGDHCAEHRRQLLREQRGAAICSVDGCERKLYATDLCKLHYNRVLAHGAPGPAQRRHPPRPERYIERGYAWVLSNGRRVGEHRVVMEKVLGRPLRKGESPHHKNGVRDDNRADNLELWVTPPRYGQRVTDLVQWIVDQYPEAAAKALKP